MHNEGKLVVEKRLIRTVKKKMYNHMTAISKMSTRRVFTGV